MPLSEGGRRTEGYYAVTSPLVTLVDGRDTIDATGVAEPVSATSIMAVYIVITAETDNTNAITVGASTVVGALATRRGVPLNAGDSVTLWCVDLSKVYVDVITNGEGYTFVYAKEVV